MNSDSEVKNCIKFAIEASDGDDPYVIGLRNGMRLCLSLLDGNEPEYEAVSKTEGAKE